MVKVTAERTPECQVRLNIEVEPERIEQSVEKAYRRLVGRLNVPGFRRGKAPRQIVERFVGRETLFQEGLQLLLNDVYREAVRDLDLHPIDQPELDLEPKAKDLKPGEPLRIKATVPVQPTVELGDYRSIRIGRVEVHVTPAEVSQMVEQAQEQLTEWVPVERGVREADRVVMDVHGEIGAYTRLYSPSGEPLLQSSGGQTIVDEKKTEFEVQPGTTRYPAGFVDQLVGMLPGQEKQFELSLPVDYKDPDLANRLAIFRVKVDEVKVKRVPPIDDDLAKSIGYESLEQMREDLRAQAQAAAEATAAQVHEDTVIAEAISRSTIEVPPALVNQEIDHLLEHARENLQRQRLGLDEYLRLTRKSEAELREEFRERAVRNVKTALLLDRIAEQENVQVSPEEVDQEIQSMTYLAGKEADRIRQALATPAQRDAVEHRVRNRKVVQLLVETARSGETAEATAEAASEDEAAEATVETAGSAEPQPQAAGSGEVPAAEPDGADAGQQASAGGAGAAAAELDKE